MKNADVFLGLSTGNIVTQEMVKSMAKRPVVFALANPEPEISYREAVKKGYNFMGGGNIPKP